MHVGLFAINYATCGDPEVMIRVARHAEAAGLESVWTGEHVALPRPRPDGFSMGPELPMFDTIVGLSLVAAATTTIRLGTGIIILPLRNPAVLAKELASLDLASRGRLMVGVGAGYVAEEFAAAGVSLRERGRRLDDGIAAMRALWGPDPDYDGEFVTISGVDAFPKPHRVGGPPIIVGGIADAAIERAVTVGNGWYVFNVDDDLAGRCMDAIREALDTHERPAELGELEITMTPVGSLTAERVARFEELGVHRLVVLPDPDAPREQRHEPVPVDDILRNVDRVATLVG